MKKKFNSKRIVEWNINCNTGKIPVYCVKPLKDTDSPKKIVLFIQGLNGNGSTIYYWNYPAFDNAYLVSYDGRAQANNVCKPSRFFKTYIKDIDIVVNDLKSRFNVDEIYLMGESWGASLAVLYMKYFPNKIAGEIVWNMPYNFKDVSKGNEQNPFKRNILMLFTFLFSINTYDDAPFVTDLTNNKLLLRTIKLLRKNKISNKVIIAAWRAFKPAWKFLFKHKKDFKKLNITYIQSEQDIMREMKAVNKLAKYADNVHIFKEGFHILTFDENANDKLFSIISNVINS